MQEDIKKAIKTLTGKIDDKVESADALRYSQAALNLIHLQSNITECEKNSKK